MFLFLLLDMGRGMMVLRSFPFFFSSWFFFRWVCVYVVPEVDIINCMLSYLRYSAVKLFVRLFVCPSVA